MIILIDNTGNRNNTGWNVSLTVTFALSFFFVFFGCHFLQVYLHLGQCSKEWKYRLWRQARERELKRFQGKMSPETLQLIGLKFSTRGDNPTDLLHG